MKLSKTGISVILVILAITAVFAPNSVLDCTTGEECERKLIFHAPECSTIESDGVTRDILKTVDIYTDEEREFCRPSPSKLRKATVIMDSESYVTSPLDTGNYEISEKNISLNDPWAIEIADDGSKIISQQNGELVQYKNEELIKRGSVESLEQGNGGLMGAALHPNYSENSEVYLYYTYDQFLVGDDERIKNRLSKFEFTEQGLRNEEVLLNNITGGLHHSGGRVAVGPDDKLYLTTGDAGFSSRAQQTDNLIGKILRLNLDGSIPEDNPFDNEVYSYGHRNPQGLGFGKDDRIYSSEHGDQRHDEVNLIEKGGNYGWPITECGSYRDKEAKKIDFTESITCFEEWTMAPSGITFVDQPGHPWDGNLFVAGLRGEQVQRLEIESGKAVSNSIFYINKQGEMERSLSNRLRDITFYDGSLWIIGDEEGLVELSPEN